MRKIDITNYILTVPVWVDKKDGAGNILKDSTGVPQRELKHVDVPYDMKTSLISILFEPATPETKLTARDLLKRHLLGEKIEQTTDTLLLESSEYDLLVSTIDAFKGFGKNEGILVQRVLEAKEVEVEIKK